MIDAQEPLEGECDAGYTLVEVLVAFAVASLALTAIYASLGTSTRAIRAAEMRERVVQDAQSLFDTLVQTPPATDTAGTLASGATWSATFTALPRYSRAPELTSGPVALVMTVRDRSGRTLLTLEGVTFRAVTP
jgi:prepilin-type N-terminal cleavage/methylation domain-containing protein